MNLRSLARCPTSVQLIHGALYGLAFETCSKTHFKVLLRSLQGLPKCAVREEQSDELEKSENIDEELIPCDSCVALFEREKDMKDHLAWCRDTWLPYLRNRSLPGVSLDLSTH